MVLNLKAGMLKAVKPNVVPKRTSERPANPAKTKNKWLPPIFYSPSLPQSTSPYFCICNKIALSIFFINPNSYS